jgi:hypothetical protein
MILGIFYPIFIKFIGLLIIAISVIGVIFGILGIQTPITMSLLIGLSLIGFVTMTWVVSFVYFVQTL